MNQQPRVLVADDEPLIRALVTIAFEAEGYDVDTAADGAEALAKACQRVPQAIVLDLMMPVMDGWEFRRRQLEDPSVRSIHVIVMSANRCLPAAEAVLSPCAMLAKPFDLIDLLQRTTRCAAESTTGRHQAV